MIIGFAPYGAGYSGPALDYLTGYLVNGESRSVKPEVVRGSVDATAEVIDSLPFERRYSSGVMSFHEDDKVTPEIQEDVMNRFESAVFAGIPADRRSIVWIKHRDKNRTELHFVAARVDLGTGKSLNIAPPTPQSRLLIDTLRESINRRYGFADPSDPDRAQSVSLPSHIAKLAAQAKRLGRSAKPDIREEIAKALEKQVTEGAVKSRADVTAFLKNQGYAVTRTGINYMTVALPDGGERVRLKGPVFREHFSPADLQHAAPRHDPGRLLTLDRRLERLVEKRAEFHRERYGNNPETKKEPPITEVMTNDRTRNEIVKHHPTIREVSSGTGAAIRNDAFGLNQAAQRFCVAANDVELARERLVQADRAFAHGFDEALVECERINRLDSLVQSYGAMPMTNRRDVGFDMELGL